MWTMMEREILMRVQGEEVIHFEWSCLVVQRFFHKKAVLWKGSCIQGGTSLLWRELTEIQWQSPDSLVLWKHNELFPWETILSTQWRNWIPLRCKEVWRAGCWRGSFSGLRTRAGFTLSRNQSALVLSLPACTTSPTRMSFFELECHVLNTVI